MKPEIIMSLSWLALDIGLFAYLFTQINLGWKIIIRKFLFNFVLSNIIFYGIFAVAVHNAEKNIGLLLNFKFFLIFAPFSAFFSLAIIIATVIIANFFQKFYQKR